MADPIEALDAYKTLKPGELPFTLQSGDPFSVSTILFYVGEVRKAGMDESDPIKARDLLKRATAAEEVAWRFKDYQRGTAAEEEPETQTAGTVKFRLDVYDARKALRNECSRSDSQLLEAVEIVKQFEHSPGEELRYSAAFHKVESARKLLREAAEHFSH